VEKDSPFGWDRWVGPTGAIIGMSTFGESAPMKVLQAKFGFTTEHISPPPAPSSASTTPRYPASRSNRQTDDRSARHPERGNRCLIL
jgi:hypothetical protein